MLYDILEGKNLADGEEWSDWSPSMDEGKIKIKKEILDRIIKEEFKKVREAFMPGPFSKSEKDREEAEIGIQRRRDIESGRITQADLRREKLPTWMADELGLKATPKGPTAFDRSYNFGMEQKDFAKRASGGSPNFQKVAAQDGVNAYIDKFKDGWKVVYKGPNQELWFSTIAHQSPDDAFADIEKNHEIQLGSVDVVDPEFE
jgi:hypothetical protein